MLRSLLSSRLLPTLVMRASRLRTRTSRARGRSAILVAIVVFVALELGMGLGSEYYPRLRDPFYGDKLVKLKHKFAQHPEAPTVVVLGTSRTGFGFHGARVDERVRNQGLQVVTFNYGIPASGPITHRLYTRRMLADGVKPDLLVVELLPSMLAQLNDGSPWESQFVFGDRFTRDEVTLLCQYGYPEEPTRERWRGATFNPWYTLRFQLLGRVVQSWIPWHLRYDWSRGCDESGWGTPLRDQATPAEHARGAEVARGEYGPVLADLKPTGPALQALKDLITECQQHGVTVQILWMPEDDTFQSLYPRHVQERIDTVLATLCQEHNVEVINARDWIDASMFSDGHHLLRPGAMAFSDRFAEEVVIPWLQSRGGSP